MSQASDGKERPFDLAISDLAFGGDGVGREDEGPAQGRVVFVPGTVPGDLVRVQLVSSKRRHAHARLLEVLEPSPNRVAPPCPIHDTCGGCGWQQVAISEQRRCKQALVRRQMGQAVTTAAGEPTFEMPEMATGSALEWRQRIRARFRVRDGEVVLGLHERETHRIVDMPRCAVALPAVDAGVDILRAALAEAGDADGTAVIAATDRGRPVLSVRLRCAPAVAQALAHALGLAPDLEGALVEVAGQHTRLGASAYSYPGADRVSIAVGGFSQANPEVTARLVNDLLDETARSGATSAADLYAGAGTLTLPLARRLERVVAIEGDEGAVHELRRSAAAQGLGHLSAHVFNLDVPCGLPMVAASPPDLVVLDPPREGASALMPVLVALAPRLVIYVSCNPATQARDLRILSMGGFELVRVRTYDMFPHTAHVETMAVLQRVSAK